MSPRQRLRQLSRFSTRLAKRQSQAAKAVKGFLLLFGGVMAGAAQFMDTPTVGIPWNRIIGIVGVLLIFAGGLWPLVADREVSMLLDGSRRALDEAEDRAQDTERLRHAFFVEASALKREVRRRDQLAQLSRLLLEKVERAIVSGDKDISSIVDDALNYGGRMLLGVLGVEGGERWTIHVFQYVPARTELVWLAGHGADRDRCAPGRQTWRPWEGFVGTAFMKNGETILANTAVDAAREMLITRQEKRSPHDPEHYRSIAAIPIRVGNRMFPWGVAIATSDRIGRFGGIDDETAGMNVDAVRAIAATVALLAAARHIRDAPASNNAEALLNQVGRSLSGRE